MRALFFWVQAVGLLMPAAWLTVAVPDNLLYPVLNGPDVAPTLDMAEMRRDYPDAYRVVAHRRIVDARAARRFFGLAVAWEVLAILALWGAIGAFAAAGLGYLPTTTEQAAGLAAAMVFTAT